MPSRTFEWPSGWPSYTSKDADSTDTFQSDLKAQIISQYGIEAITASWRKTILGLRTLRTRLASEGNAAIPILSYDDVVTSPSDALLRSAKATGCFVVRGVISCEEAEQHFKDIVTFVDANRGQIDGWPKASVAIYSMFSSPTQLKIKTNPRHLALQRRLNALWFDSECTSKEEQEAMYEPVLYPDACRIRQPGQDFLGLGPHVDAGSLCRWADAEYFKTYDAIFSGSPENYDPYDMTYRKNANPSMWPGGAHCSIFRSFQGWTALTPCKPGEGGLMVVPDVKIVTAYMMLRPLFKAPEDGDWEDAEKWTVDQGTWFPGTNRWDSQNLSRTSHPHLFMEETLIGIPDVQPGDTIWWHADMCHAVEPKHNGRVPASVVYIPTAPSTPKNVVYISQHWKDLVAGQPPEDYKYLDGSGSELILSTLNERKLKGALSLDGLNPEGRRGLGEGR